MSVNLKNVTFSYPDMPDKPIIAIETWSISKKEKVFLHGPSGGGKSTLLNLLSGILQPDTGEILVLNKNLGQMNNAERDKFRANYVGYIFQQFNLIPYLNAVENIQLANQFTKDTSKSFGQKDIKEILHTFRISDADSTAPTGKLSIGQQQRIAIIRAMINQPEILIADEPTSSLDEMNKNVFMSGLLEMISKQDTTLIFVSHDLSLAHNFDRIDALEEINSIRKCH
ncbi:MAG: ABC transporter ATP-binding protein [Cellvibrionales bacterium TMED49]|nr:ABC transporter ATP-binding protein [Porticoccaceae bacterium]OUU38025.1 MAG: ABC transporter ATP-binding protein [Cellvibrionales bacterium TMED49]